VQKNSLLYQKEGEKKTNWVRWAGGDTKFLTHVREGIEKTTIKKKVTGASGKKKKNSKQPTYIADSNKGGKMGGKRKCMGRCSSKGSKIGGYRSTG